MADIEKTLRYTTPTFTIVQARLYGVPIIFHEKVEPIVFYERTGKPIVFYEDTNRLEKILIPKYRYTTPTLSLYQAILS